MLTNEDIQQIVSAMKEIFPTKEDFDVRLAGMATKEDLLKNNQEILYSFEKVFATKNELYNLRDEFRQMFSDLQSSVDAFMGKTEKNTDEIAVLRHQSTRHDKWISQLAQKAEMKLDY